MKYTAHMPARQGSVRLFRFSGIDVFIHWSWFLVAVFEIQDRARSYSSITWNIAEYLALFLIVTVHEFGHALACRQVGGKANQIVLWPLGGVAYVDPPPRPGATLWSIAAGPLVNVAFMPVLYGLSHSLDAATSPDAYQLVSAVQNINLGLFCFNILPIYPLDGGQILRSLLWFVMGRARSLMVATILGFVGVIGFIGVALFSRNVWLGAIAIFMLMNCWGGLQHARALLRMAKLPRRDGFACPSCKMAPPVGDCWRCGRCGQAFDMFQNGAVCPHCSTQYSATRCMECGQQHSMQEWAVGSLAPSDL
jgi:Zn-dependent protease/DNA-directed RNA polymerase subunit RPC12/RpoP